MRSGQRGRLALSEAAAVIKDGAASTNRSNTPVAVPEKTLSGTAHARGESRCLSKCVLGRKLRVCGTGYPRTCATVSHAITSCVRGERVSGAAKTPAVAGLPSSGGRSEPGVSRRSRKSAEAIPRREFGLRDP